MDQQPLIQKISKWVSAVFNPLVALMVYFIYYCFHHLTFRETWDYFWPIFLFVALPAVLWIFWNVKTGRYSNADVSDRNQRKTLYFFIEASLILYLLFFYRQHDTADLVMLCVFILLVIMQISNYFIKSSMHTAFNVFTAALFFADQPFLGTLWLFIALLVGISRIIVRRHTPKEVMMGAALGLAVSFLYLYINIQQTH